LPRLDDNNRLNNLILLLRSVFGELLAHHKKWWPKQHPSLAVGAHIWTRKRVHDGAAAGMLVVVVLLPLSSPM
jgi:hypothetical protein